MRRAMTSIENLQRWAANPPSRGELYAAAAAYVNGARGEAVEALYRGLAPVVHMVAFALSYGSRDRYEDLAQDGFAFLGDWVGRLPKRAVARRVSIARLFLADLQVYLEDQMAMERGGVTVSAAMARFMRQVAAIQRRLVGEGRKATPEAIAAEIARPKDGRRGREADPERVSWALQLLHVLELDRPVGEEGSTTIGELIADERYDPAAAFEAALEEDEARKTLAELEAAARLGAEEEEAIEAFKRLGFVPKALRAAYDRAQAKLRWAAGLGGAAAAA
ncbi:MAG TPA: hypothetical protein ENJ76_00580 [Oceanithermus sp.]|nr:hypothetical protein [Oceanithermus sp.]